MQAAGLLSRPKLTVTLQTVGVWRCRTVSQRVCWNASIDGHREDWFPPSWTNQRRDGQEEEGKKVDEQKWSSLFQSFLLFFLHPSFLVFHPCLSPFCSPSSYTSSLPLVSSVSSTSHCRSSEPARWPHPAGCSCICSAVAGSVVGPRSPSPPARPSWCPGWTRPPGAAREQHLIRPWNQMSQQHMNGVNKLTINHLLNPSPEQQLSIHSNHN